LIKKYGVEGILSKQLLDGKIDEKVEEVLNGVYLSLSEGVQKSKKKKLPVIREYLSKNQMEIAGSQKRSMVKLSVSGKRKTCLKDIWKVFYLD
jgi:hypothetical protein